MNFKIISLLFLLNCILFSPLYGVQQEQSDEKQPVLFYTDSQTYDRELGILILKGHVEFDHQGNILEADYVTYNENTDIVTASGNVRLRQLNGDVNFAEYMELTGDMKEGIVLQLRTLLEDNSKIAAIEGRKFEDREELDQAVYTPCELCGDKSPTWQINARRAVKDNVSKDIQFTDAQLRFFDIPVLYLPYLTQPLERRSGFLIPQPEYSTALGASLEIPYFIALSEDKDMTVSTVLYTEQNPLFLGQYRQAFRNGYIRADGAITQYKQSSKDKKAIEVGKFDIPKWRNFILGEGKFNLNDIWRVSFDGGYVGDKTFFRKYGFSGWKNESNLTSQGTLEGFLNQRDYAVAEVYHFQGLRDSDKQEHISSPLPYLEYSGYSAVDPWGGRFKFDGNLLNLYRKDGINVQRGIGIAGWQRPWISSLGQVYTLFASVRGDLYQVENFHQKAFKPRKKLPEDMRKRGGARFFPQAGLNWRWPFVNSYQSQNFILQPVAQLIFSPDKAIGVDARHIPDEDSTDFEFNDLNLFSKDRYPGYDLIDTGSRGVYGGEFLTTGGLIGDIEVFLGQSYSFSKPDPIDIPQGFGRYASDYVGRIAANPFSWLNFYYRFRLDQKTLNTRVGEVGAGVGPAIARLAVDYVFVSKHAGTSDKRDLNQINFTLSSQIIKHWTVVGMARQNLNKKKLDLNKKNIGGGPLQRGIGVIYRDDCFGLGASIQRQYYSDRDLRPETLYLVTVFLKNVGEFGHGFNGSQGLFGERSTQAPPP
ncbi:MAG: LPS assembly protein LptD [Alphaproteobacteria bacterium]|nr:LPS assembly protein LptD [Alphaproteobacteria bacterium]